MERDVYVLAQFERKIELMNVSDDPFPKPGETFNRIPLATVESWTIIKVFQGLHHERIHALVTLNGMENTKALFAVELPKEKTFEEAFDESVSRMGGEA